MEDAGFFGVANKFVRVFDTADEFFLNSFGEVFKSHGPLAAFGDTEQGGVGRGSFGFGMGLCDRVLPLGDIKVIIAGINEVGLIHVDFKGFKAVTIIILATGNDEGIGIIRVAWGDVSLGADTVIEGF